MNSVVSEGTGKGAKVEGYSIGGKTGTSEDGVKTNKYITSFMGISPTEDPELVILVVLYNPTGEGGHQGGAVAAPTGGKILSEVLPYMEVKKEEEAKENVKVPNVIGMTIKEAKKTLEECGLEIKLNVDSEEGIEKDKVTVTEQTPKQGITLEKGEVVMCDISL